MQNEFEKQVQQKMEELDLVPSAPVWQKIEAQIRQKKDRRRLILWIPLLLILLVGGTWWLSQTNEHSEGVSHTATTLESIDKNEQTNTSEPLSKDLNSPIINQPSKENTSIPDQSSSPVISHEENTKETSANISKTKINNIQQETGKTETAALKNREENRNPSSGLKSPEDKLNVPIPAVKDGQPIAKNKTPENTRQKLLESQIENKQANQPNPETTVQEKIEKEKNNSDLKTVDTVLSKPSSAVPEEKREPALPKAQDKSAKTDTLVAIPEPIAATPKRKKGRSGWKFGLTAGTGISGLSDGLQFFDGQKSLDAGMVSSPIASTGYIFYFEPAPEKNGNSFSAGLTAKKYLGNKFALTTGLQYDYYSTVVEVGRKYDSASGNRQYTNQYFNQVTMFQNYRNSFHYLSLPASLEWKVLNKIPVYLHGGLNLSYLLATNALKYDYLTMLYKSNKERYNSLQVFSTLGLDYALLDKKHTLLVGPQLQYGLSRLESGNGNHRFYSIGLRAQFLFQKK
jgi:hypothetical protein